MPEQIPWGWGAALAVLNVPLFLLYGRLMFGGLQGFIDAVVFWFKPDLWSWFDDEYLEDLWAEIRLTVFFATCGGLLFAEYFFIVAPYILHAPATR